MGGFPVHAGIDLVRATGLGRLEEGFPVHAGIDLPRLEDRVASRRGFPVHAGIDLTWALVIIAFNGFPRTRGDRPYLAPTPTWKGFPVHAGIDPHWLARWSAVSPYTRG